MAEKDKNSGNQTQIIVALIGLVGVVSTALFSNWDKIFPVSDSQQFSLPSSSNSQQTPKKYAVLETFLAAKRFKEADQETRKIMLELTNRESESWIDRSSIEKVSCQEIRTLDQLWKQYSNNQFGFTVQKAIFRSIGNTERFGDAVGWRENGNWLTTNELNYSLDSPQGHLPSTSRDGSLTGGWLVWFFLSDASSKVANCIN
ncbi:MAG: GUN4 domain-containing protein [Crocosphaera sp.]|nr:GUN4 domain-containing protein [Crocosphaera sp.]